MSRPLILHVEDDESDAALLERALRRAQVSVTTFRAEDGQVAIDYLAGTGKYADRTAYPLPGLVLLDIKMPRIDGFDVLKWIRGQAQFAHLPVVMLSSSDEPSDIQTATRLGANCYIVKQANYGDVIAFLASFRGQGDKA